QRLPVDGPRRSAGDQPTGRPHRAAGPGRRRGYRRNVRRQRDPHRRRCGFLPARLVRCRPLTHQASLSRLVSTLAGCATVTAALAVPLPAVGTVLDELAGAGYSGLVTDVTSVKGPVGALVRRSGLLAGYVGGHPMAGRETSGFAAADGDLFRDCAWVLCLEPGETDLSDWLTLAQVVTGLGARVVPATAAEHDLAVAAVSHVPHLLACALTE